MELNDEERHVLDCELTWRTAYRKKSEAIEALGMRPHHYYLVLLNLLHNPEVEMQHPELVRRLQSLANRRAIERGTPPIFPTN